MGIPLQTAAGCSLIGYGRVPVRIAACERGHTIAEGEHHCKRSERRHTIADSCWMFIVKAREAAERPVTTVAFWGTPLPGLSRGKPRGQQAVPGHRHQDSWLHKGRQGRNSQGPLFTAATDYIVAVQMLEHI